MKVTFNLNIHQKQNIAQQICDDLHKYAANLPATVGNGEVSPCALSRLEIRAKILEIEKQMLAEQESGKTEKCDLDTVFPVRHIFAPDAVAREMRLPAGGWIIGKIHKHSHLNFITKGRVAVLTEEGPMVITAPYTFVSAVGTKRLVLVLEDTIWTTVHVTTETDLKKIEEYVIAKSYDDVPLIENEHQAKELS